jgi:outer membrane protein assembly factor BamB
MKRKLRFLASTLFAAVFAVGADYPQWRGPARDGISTETRLLQQWPASGPRLLWSIQDAGDGYGAVAVAGGRVYFVSNRGMEDEIVQALSVEDGKRLWSARIGKVGNPDQAPSYPSARSTPTIDGDLLYVFGSDGDLACLETATGKIRWQKNVRKDFKGEPGKWAYAESPLVDSDAVIVSPGGPEAGLIAFRKRNGDLLWKSPIPGGEAAGYASAVPIDAGGRRQYVQFLAKGVVGVDAKSGEFLWRYDETSKGPANIPTSLVHGDYVYSTARSLGAAALIRVEGGAAKQVYFERGLPSTIGGAVLWKGILYGTTNEGLVAADFATGKVRWKDETLGAGSVLYADNRLFIHCEDGDIALVEATPDAFRQHGRFKPPDQPNHPRGAREKAWAYPVVAGGRLYVRDLGMVWCYDVRRK